MSGHPEPKHLVAQALSDCPQIIHFLPRELRVRMYPVPVMGAEYRYQAYHELLTACGHRFTSGGYSRRGWTITSNAEDVTCGSCKITQEWRAAIRWLARQGIIDELPRYIP